MASVSGTITIVQEDRFQLEGEDGGKRLFILSHRSPTEIEQLQKLQRAGRRIRVSYEPAPGLIAWRARAVAPDA